MKHVFDAIRPGQPTANLNGIPTIRIPVRGGLTVDLDHPTAAARYHVDVLAHVPPFKIGRTLIASVAAEADAA